MSTDEAVALVHGEMETVPAGERTHQAVQTCLADVILGGKALAVLVLICENFVLFCKCCTVPLMRHCISALFINGGYCNWCEILVDVILALTIIEFAIFAGALYCSRRGEWLNCGFAAYKKCASPLLLSVARQPPASLLKCVGSRSAPEPRTIAVCNVFAKAFRLVSQSRVGRTWTVISS